MSTNQRTGRQGRASPSGGVIAIDGPAGSGKSTVAREVARRLHLRYLDTGAMYRALTWQVLEQHLALTEPALAAAAEALDLEIDTDPDAPNVRVGGRDVTTAVRSPRVTALVSRVSAVPGVRSRMVRQQRAVIADGGIVVEGRDIGLVVAPEANPKIFLTAATDVRAVRRGAQRVEAPGALSVVKNEIELRDRADSTRQASPMGAAADAIWIDSSGLSVAEVVERVLALVGADV